MSILKEMGIQQWRVRQRILPAEPELPAIEPEPVSMPNVESISATINVDEPVALEPELRPDNVVEPQAVPILNALPKAAPTAKPVVIEHAPSSPAPNTNRMGQDPIADLDWRGLQNLVDGQSQCSSCGVGKSLLGAGDPNANWLFVIDAPHSQDIASQQLLHSRAGQLFEAMLSAVGLERDSIYMTSVFKCLASEDLSQSPNCDKILHRQIALVQPEVVIALGEFAAQSVIKANESLGVLRTSEHACFRTKVPIVPTYTVAQMLDEPALKAQVWQDLKRCLSISPTQN